MERGHPISNENRPILRHYRATQNKHRIFVEKRPLLPLLFGPSGFVLRRPAMVFDPTV